MCLLLLSHESWSWPPTAFSKFLMQTHILLRFVHVQSQTIGELRLIPSDYGRNTPTGVSDSGMEVHQASNVYRCREGSHKTLAMGNMTSANFTTNNTVKILRNVVFQSKTDDKMCKLFSNPNLRL